MPTLQFGPIPFAISPVTIMKCFVAIGWSARASKEALGEYNIFHGAYFPYLVGLDNEMPLADFCAVSADRIREVIDQHGLRQDFVTRFGDRLCSTLRSASNQSSATLHAAQYEGDIQHWLYPPLDRVARRAAEIIAELGVSPLREAMAAVGSFGNAVYGKHVPSLGAVCVQMDVVAGCRCPGLRFALTLLHEEVHAAIHAQMGEDDRRPELKWLNELAATLTSQYAVLRAVSEVCGPGSEGDDPGAGGTHTDLVNEMTSGLEYDCLAKALVRDTGDPLIPWRAWSEVFRLNDGDKANYARGRVITPILRRLGWNVSFPYHYDGKYVTVFI